MKTIGIKSVKIYTSSGTNVATYSYTTDGYEYLMGSDTGRKTASVTYTGTSGKSYYAAVSYTHLHTTDLCVVTSVKISPARCA